VRKISYVIFEVEHVIRNFEWETMKNMYGCAHSSIIGFISSQWLRSSPNRSILDGAPSPKIGEGRRGQRNSDILLCLNDKPVVVVEVETNVKSYENKLETLYEYIKNDNEFKGLDIGLLFMNNLCSGERKYKHNWDEIKELVRKNHRNIVLISIEKEKSKFLKENTILNSLRKRNDYYPWDISKIDYWMYTFNNVVKEGNLWMK